MPVPTPALPSCYSMKGGAPIGPGCRSDQSGCGVRLQMAHLAVRFLCDEVPSARTARWHAITAAMQHVSSKIVALILPC